MEGNQGEQHNARSVMFTVAKMRAGPKVGEKIWNGVSQEMHDFFNKCFDYVGMENVDYG